MKRSVVALLFVAMLAFAGAGVAKAEVITFGLEGSSFFTTDSTIGFHNPFTGQFSNGDFYPITDSGYANAAAAASSEWVAFNGYSDPFSMFTSSSGDLFSLNSFWLAGAWGSQTLTIIGYINGIVVDAIAIGISTTAQVYLFTSFTGIDAFSISTGDDYVRDLTLSGIGQQWALGSVTVNAFDSPNNPSPTPEPGTIILMGAGLLGMLGMRKRFKK